MQETVAHLAPESYSFSGIIASGMPHMTIGLIERHRAMATGGVIGVQDEIGPASQVKRAICMQEMWQAAR